jgi:hypothetical protein
MRLSFLRSAALVPLLAVSACATPEQIQAALEARAERDRIVCEELGFEPGTDSYTLCLLIQDTNRRIDLANQQLRWLESDLRRQELLDSRFHRWRW